MVKKVRNCIYSSGVVIEDIGLLSTLTLFYDKIFLLHPYDLNPEAHELMMWPFDYLDDLEIHQRYYLQWVETWKELFNAHVLEVLPPPLETGEEPVDLDDRLRKKLGIKFPYFTKSDTFDGSVAVAMQALFGKNEEPEFILSLPGNTTTEHLADVLATTLLEYRIPKISALNAEQILQLRDEIAPYKEGFIDYLNSMVDNVEERLKANAGNEGEAALRTIQRKIEPDLDEYLRRKLPDQILWWSGLVRKISAGAGEIVKCHFIPWQLKNYPAFIEKLAAVGEQIATRLSDNASNQHRAFQLLGKIEKHQKYFGSE